MMEYWNNEKFILRIPQYSCTPDSTYLLTLYAINASPWRT